MAIINDNSVERYKLYGQKTSAWPDEARYYLGSDALADNAERLAKIYQLKSSDVSELLIDLILAGNDLSAIGKLAEGRLRLSEERLENFIADFFIYILFPLDKYYPELGIKAEMGQRKIESREAQAFAQSFDQELDGEVMAALEGAIDSLDNIDAKEEADAVLGLVRNSLTDILKSESPELAEGFNNSLRIILSDDPKNRDKILQMMTADKSQLTEKSLLIHDKPEAPTVANWLADFLYRAQNKISDSLALTEYLTGSVNCRRLDAKERRAVQNLFQFYRNIKLYPEVFSGLDPAKWQILPMPEVPARAAASPAKAAKSEPILEKPAAAANSATTSSARTSKLSQYDWSGITGLERRALLEEIGASKKELDEYLKSVT